MLRRWQHDLFPLEPQSRLGVQVEGRFDDVNVCAVCTHDSDSQPNHQRFLVVV